MKRYIRASWNGIVPISKIVRELGISRDEAKAFQEWLYDNDYDSGFRSLDDFFYVYDLHELYDRMHGITVPVEKLTDARREASLCDDINHELSDVPSVECTGVKIDRANEELIVSLEKKVFDWNKMKTTEFIAQDVIIPFDIAYMKREHGWAMRPIISELYNAINEM